MLKKCLFLLLICLIAGCATIHKDWENTQRINTADGYKKFLNEHPQSEYSQTAKDNIKKLEWDEARQLNTVDAYRAFLRSHPQSEYSQTAKDKMINIINGLERQFKNCKTSECSDSVFSLWENAVWETTKELGGRDRYEKYLLLFPSGKHVSLANEAIDDIDWYSCKDGRSKDSCEKYLSSHKKGKHRKEAKQIIVDNEFMIVKEKNTVGAYDEFLKSHRSHEGALTMRRQLLYSIAVASGKLEDWLSFYDKSQVSSYKRRKWDKSSQSAYEQMMTNAETEIERLLYEKAIANPSLNNYRAYLKRFPKGSHRQQIIVLMEPLFFEEVRGLNTIEAYNKYLKQYPSGFSKSKVLALLDPLLFKKAQEEDWYSAYEAYIKKCPNGQSVQKARERLTWLKANKAEVVMEYKKIVEESASPYWNVGRPFWPIDTVFKETSGKMGFKVSGSSARIDDIYGGSWSGSGRGTLKIPAGGTVKDDYWVSSTDHVLCNGFMTRTWSGEDAGGHSIRLKQKVKLQHTGCPGRKK